MSAFAHLRWHSPSLASRSICSRHRHWHQGVLARARAGARTVWKAASQGQGGAAQRPMRPESETKTGAADQHVQILAHLIWSQSPHHVGTTLLKRHFWFAIVLRLPTHPSLAFRLRLVSVQSRPNGGARSAHTQQTDKCHIIGAKMNQTQKSSVGDA